MNKLKEYIYKWLDGKTVRGITVTPLQINLLIDVYNAKIRKEKIEFIDEGVARILEKCGIKTTPVGIGWVA